MNNFKNFNIKPNVVNFTGEKIKIARVLNTPIQVLDYKVDKSKVAEGTKCLTLHIERDGIQHVIFSGSKILLDQIERVPKQNFPFVTTIIRDKEYYEFT